MLDIFQTTQQQINMEHYNARLVHDNDLPILAEWWSFYHDSEYPVSFLSPLGVCVDGESGLMAAGFIYPLKTRSGVSSYADYCIVNPDLPKEQRNQSIEMLIDGMINLSKNLGHELIIANARIPKLINRMTDKGFANLGECFYMARALNG